MRSEFFMPMARVPTVTHQEQQVSCKSGKPVFYEPTELKTARIKLKGHLSRHVPEKKYTGAIRVVVKWLYPITGKHQDGEYKTTKPDCDNAIKLLNDICTDLGFWKDDAIIASLVIEKFYADQPGIYVCIESLEGR